VETLLHVSCLNSPNWTARNDQKPSVDVDVDDAALIDSNNG